MATKTYVLGQIDYSKLLQGDLIILRKDSRHREYSFFGIYNSNGTVDCICRKDKKVISITEFSKLPHAFVKIVRYKWKEGISLQAVQWYPSIDDFYLDFSSYTYIDITMFLKTSSSSPDCDCCDCGGNSEGNEGNSDDAAGLIIGVAIVAAVIVAGFVLIIVYFIGKAIAIKEKHKNKLGGACVLAGIIGAILGGLAVSYQRNTIMNLR